MSTINFPSNNGWNSETTKWFGVEIKPSGTVSSISGFHRGCAGSEDYDTTCKIFDTNQNEVASASIDQSDGSFSFSGLSLTDSEYWVMTSLDGGLRYPRYNDSPSYPYTSSDFDVPSSKILDYDQTNPVENTGWAYNIDSLTVEAIKAPSTPQNLTSTVSQDDITLDWDSVNWNGDQGHYDVFRATASGTYESDYTHISNVASGTTSYTDSNLNDGERYYYRVEAVNSGGESGLSNETAETTSLPAPSSLSASASADDISLSWTDNSDNEDGFKIERSVDGSAYSQIATTSSSSYSDTGLLDGEQYTYRVRTYTEHVNSSYSGTASATTSLPAPSNFTVS